jgi:hypothetical protein
VRTKQWSYRNEIEGLLRAGKALLVSGRSQKLKKNLPLTIEALNGLFEKKLVIKAGKVKAAGSCNWSGYALLFGSRRSIGYAERTTGPIKQVPFNVTLCPQPINY